MEVGSLQLWPAPAHFLLGHEHGAFTIVTPQRMEQAQSVIGTLQNQLVKTVVVRYDRMSVCKQSFKLPHGSPHWHPFVHGAFMSDAVDVNNIRRNGPPIRFNNQIDGGKFRTTSASQDRAQLDQMGNKVKILERARGKLPGCLCIDKKEMAVWVPEGGVILGIH